MRFEEIYEEIWFEELWGANEYGSWLILSECLLFAQLKPTADAGYHFEVTAWAFVKNSFPNFNWI